MFELFSFDVLPRLRPESEDLQGDALAVELIIFDLLGIQTTRLVHVLIVFWVTGTSLSTHDAELGVESDLLGPPLLIPLIVIGEGLLGEFLHIWHLEDLSEQVLFLPGQLESYLLTLLISFFLF